MRGSTLLITGMVLTLPVNVALAQEAAPQASVPQAAAATPLPGPEVMRPTEKALRLTPAMARSFGRLFVYEAAGQDKGITADQRERIAEAVAQRLMSTAYKYEDSAQEILETGIGTVLRREMNHEKFTAETGREFGQNMLPAIPIARELLNGIFDDLTPIVGEHSREELRKKFEKAFEELDKFEARMKRWSEGGMKDAEDPFEEPPPPKQEPQKSTAEISMEQSERGGMLLVKNLEPATWGEFVTTAAKFLKFDGAQTAEASRILAEYTAKAEAIMTPAWKDRMRENRTKQQFYNRTRALEPFTPWLFHLNREFSEATRPLKELGRGLRRDVVALATQQQREAAFAELSRRVSEQGMTVNDGDRVLLGLKAE